MSELQTSGSILGPLRGKDLRLYPPYYVPAHLSADGRFVGWVHASPAAAKAGEGFRLDVPAHGDVAVIAECAFESIPRDVFAVLVGEDPIRANLAAEICRRSFGIETAIAIRPSPASVGENTPHFIEVTISR